MRKIERKRGKAIMEVKFYGTKAVDDALLEYAVIVARYMDKWIWCRNRERQAWEVPGGHREDGEAILNTAKRELAEETGAIEFEIMPVCVYSVKRESESFGMLFFADITELGPLPATEPKIERIDFFQDMPDELSFPLIQPKLTEQVKAFLRIGEINADIR